MGSKLLGLDEFKRVKLIFFLLQGARWVRKGGARMGDGRVEKNNLNKSRQACFTIKREG